MVGNAPDQILHTGLVRCVNNVLYCIVFLLDFAFMFYIFSKHYYFAVNFFMLVDHYGSLIRQQINSLDLNISVAWLGSELEHVISRVGGQPFLVLNWEPNTVSRAKQMTRISFPPCRYAKLFLVWSRYFMRMRGILIF